MVAVGRGRSLFPAWIYWVFFLPSFFLRTSKSHWVFFFGFVLRLFFQVFVGLWSFLDEFELVLPSFTEFFLGLESPTRVFGFALRLFIQVFVGFWSFLEKFGLVLPSLVEFYRVLPSFTELKVPLGFFFGFVLKLFFQVFVGFWSFLDKFGQVWTSFTEFYQV